MGHGHFARHLIAMRKDVEVVQARVGDFGGVRFTAAQASAHGQIARLHLENALGDAGFAKPFDQQIAVRAPGEGGIQDHAATSLQLARR